MRWTLLTLGLAILCTAYPHKKSAYEPWYTGSLIASSGKTVPPNVLSLQPYVIVNNRYGLYDLDFKFHSRPSTVNVNPLILIQSGINKYMDFQINAQTSTKFHQSRSKTEFRDISVLVGVQVYKNVETDTYIRFALNQFFPTGSYQRLNPNRSGIDIGGGRDISIESRSIHSKNFLLVLQSSYSNAMEFCHCFAFQSTSAWL